MDNCCGIVFKKQTEFLFRWVKTGLHEEIVMHYSIFLKHWSPQSRISGLYSTYLRNKLGHPRGIPDYCAYSYCRIRLTKCTLWLNRCHHITVLVFEDFVNAAHTQPPWLWELRTKSGNLWDRLYFITIYSFFSRHFHKDHNAPCLPPKILHNLCLPFLLGDWL